MHIHIQYVIMNISTNTICKQMILYIYIYIYIYIYTVSIPLSSGACRGRRAARRPRRWSRGAGGGPGRIDVCYVVYGSRCIVVVVCYLYVYSYAISCLACCVCLLVSLV